MIEIFVGDCRDVLRSLPAGGAQMCVTSPPYFGLRDYGVDGQIGVESTPDQFVAAMVEVFREVFRVLADDGTLWLNLGDSYNNFRSQKGLGQAVHSRDNLNGKPAITSGGRGCLGFKEKDLMMIPARVAIALQSDGWYLRSHIIWHKPNPMPESVTDRPTNAHESIFLLTKAVRYFYDADAVKEIAEQAGRVRADRMGGNKYREGVKNSDGSIYEGSDKRNLRNVWTIATMPFRGAHFATFPPALIEPCIKAGSRPGDVVLDPFGGAGTTGLVADRLGRNAILAEINPVYAAMAQARIRDEQPMLADVRLSTVV